MLAIAGRLNCRQKQKKGDLPTYPLRLPSNDCSNGGGGGGKTTKTRGGKRKKTPPIFVPSAQLAKRKTRIGMQIMTASIAEKEEEEEEKEENLHFFSFVDRRRNSFKRRFSPLLFLKRLGKEDHRKGAKLTLTD